MNLKRNTEMKNKYFDQALERVCDYWGVTQDDLFGRKKSTPIPSARHSLFYLLHRQGFEIPMIATLAKTHMGRPTSNARIRYGIEKGAILSEKKIHEQLFAPTVEAG